MIRTIKLSSSPIVSDRPRLSKAGHVWKPKAKLHKALKEEIQSKWTPYGLIEGGVCVVVDLFFSIPKHVRKSFMERPMPDSIPSYYFSLGELCWPDGDLMPKITRPDVDNVLKSYLDAMNGVVWKDDGCVWGALCRKWYREEAGVEIRLAWDGSYARM